MRLQFSLLTILLATAAVGIVCWRFSPRAPRNVVIEKTGRPLDLAIVGEGYFEVAHPDGRIVYTRSARLAADKWGTLVLDRNDFPINPSVWIPSDLPVIDVSHSGLVQACNRDHSIKSAVGRLSVGQFPRPDKLLPIGEGCFEVTDASGQAIQNEGGHGNAGYIAQGWLERDSSGFWSYENPALIVLVVIIVAICAQTLIFGKLIVAANQLGPRESLERVDRAG